MVSPGTCGEMASTPGFLTPQTRKSKTIAVPWRTYVMGTYQPQIPSLNVRVNQS